MRLLIVYHTAVWRDIHFTVRKGIQSIQGFVGRNTRSQMNQYFHLVGRIVFNLLYLDFTFLYSLQYRIDKRRSSLSVRYFTYTQSFIIEFRYFSPYTHHSPTFAVIIFRYINRPASLKIRIQLKRLTFQI